MTTDAAAYTIEDLVYLRHGERDMRMRLFRPDAAAPVPVVLNVHGGAWCKGDLEECQLRDEAIAASGIASAAARPAG